MNRQSDRWPPSANDRAQPYRYQWPPASYDRVQANWRTSASYGRARRKRANRRPLTALVLCSILTGALLAGAVEVVQPRHVGTPTTPATTGASGGGASGQPAVAAATAPANNPPASPVAPTATAPLPVTPPAGLRLPTPVSF